MLNVMAKLCRPTDREDAMHFAAICIFLDNQGGGLLHLMPSIISTPSFVFSFWWMEGASIKAGDGGGGGDLGGRDVTNRSSLCV